MRLLLIEPDRDTAMSIELMMKAEGFNVYPTDLGEEGVDLGKIYDYDLIVLELNLPDISGLEVLRRLRVSKVTTPVMIISATTDVVAKVQTFGGGADDYLTKPFHKDELIARCHAIVRRSKGHAQAIISAGPIAVNLDAKTIEVDGVRVHLTGKEYQMMELLALRKGQTVVKEAFLNHLYGGLDEPEPKIIDVFLCKLRAKLKRYRVDGYIQTVWGRGYALCDQPGSGPGNRTALNVLPGRILNFMSNGAPTKSADVAEALTADVVQVRTWLHNLREGGLVERDGRTSVAIWRITSAGLADHQAREQRATESA